MRGDTHVLLIDLIDEAEAITRYEAWHADGALPPEIGRSIRQAGVTAMDIYRSGNRLVMVMVTDGRFDAASKAATDATNADVAAWEARMSSVQRPLPWTTAGAKWTEASRIFSLAAQPE